MSCVTGGPLQILGDGTTYFITFVIQCYNICNYSILCRFVTQLKVISWKLPVLSQDRKKWKVGLWESRILVAYLSQLFWGGKWKIIEDVKLPSFYFSFFYFIFTSLFSFYFTLIGHLRVANEPNLERSQLTFAV